MTKLLCFTKNSIRTLTGSFWRLNSPARAQILGTDQARVFMKTKAIGALFWKSVHAALQEKSFSTTFMFYVFPNSASKDLKFHFLQNWAVPIRTGSFVLTFILRPIARNLTQPTRGSLDNTHAAYSNIPHKQSCNSNAPMQTKTRTVLAQVCMVLGCLTIPIIHIPFHNQNQQPSSTSRTGLHIKTGDIQFIIHLACTLALNQA